MEFKLSFDSVEVSTSTCNQVRLFFKVEPIFDSFKTGNFNPMYKANNLSRLIYVNNSAVYSKGVVGYDFQYTKNVVGRRV